MEWYNGKKVFITGGSSGIGRATAERLVSWGADVCIASRTVSRLDEAAAGLGRLTVRPGQTVMAIPLDVTRLKDCHMAAARAVEGLGGMDLLVNNAGASWPGTLERTPDSMWESLMQVNYLGTVNCTRAFLPHFISKRDGRIVNVASVLGFMGLFGYSAYAASKFAVVGFSESVRQDLLRYNVRVSVFYPPDTDTPMLREENRIKPEESRLLAGKIRPMTADGAALAMLRGAARGRFVIVPGTLSKVTFALNRYAPFLLRGMLDRTLRRYWKRRAGAAVPDPAAGLEAGAVPAVESPDLGAGWA